MTTGDPWHKRALWLMAGLVVLRILFAAYPPLGVDEAYAIAAARGWSLSFFDHPPIGFLSPLVPTTLLGIETPFLFRLPTIIFGTITAYMLWRIGGLIGSPRAAFWALALYAASPAFALSGSYIVPDGPLGVGTTISVYWLLRIARHDGQAPLRWWLWVGLALAFALASKYQAALIPISVLVFTLISPPHRRWLVQPGPWLASAVGLLGLVPMVIWNATHKWASFTFHSNRTGDGLNLDNFALMMAGQALYLLPPVAVIAIWGLRRGLAARRTRPDLFLLALIALGPIIAFNIIYLISERSYPHWTMPGWIFALPLGALALDGASDATRRLAARWTAGLAALMLVLLSAALLHTRTGILTRFTHDSPPAWDRTLDAFDYSPLRAVLEARGLLAEGTIIATRGWIEAGFMSTALNGEFPVRVLRGNKHHFRFLPGETAAGPALLLHPVRVGQLARQTERMLQIARQIDPAARALEPVLLPRGGRDYAAVIVIALTLPPG